MFFWSLKEFLNDYPWQNLYSWIAWIFSFIMKRPVNLIRVLLIFPNPHHQIYYGPSYAWIFFLFAFYVSSLTSTCAFYVLILIFCVFCAFSYGFKNLNYLRCQTFTVWLSFWVFEVPHQRVSLKIRYSDYLILWSSTTLSFGHKCKIIKWIDWNYMVKKKHFDYKSLNLHLFLTTIQKYGSICILQVEVDHFWNWPLIEKDFF